MKSSTLTSKGQVTIPVEIRRLLGLMPGDRVTFVIDDDRVTLTRGESRVEAAFGLIKTDRSVTLEEMDEAIRQRAGQ